MITHHPRHPPHPPTPHASFYLDDNWHNTTQASDPSWQPPEGFCDHSPIGGPSEENFWCTADMGLTQADTTALTDAWRETEALVTQTLVGAGSWAWAFFTNWAVPTDSASCVRALTAACSPAFPSFSQATFVQWTLNAPPYNGTVHRTSPLPRVALDIAVFQTVRGPWWWLGYGWVGCSVPYDFPDALRVDLGEPLGICKETAQGSGVFERAWSGGTSSVDCNALEGQVRLG